MLPTQKNTLVALINDVVDSLLSSTNKQFRPTVILERPKILAHGDFACNIAMQLAKHLKVNARELAKRISDRILADERAYSFIDSVEIAGPGFINFRLSINTKHAIVPEILAQGIRFGRRTDPAGSVMIEFVSANPTGPLHVGHGRQAVLGDALAELLGTQGCKVHREFYYNDAGVQIQTLAASVQSRAKGLKPGDENWPKIAYNGVYIADIAQDFLAGKTVQASDCKAVTASGNTDDIESIRIFAVTYLRREQDIDLQTLGVRFDQYYLESSLYQDGSVENTVSALIAAGHTYEQEGALWLRTTDYGDDKDRVMRKTDGTYTYFVPDVAYHTKKWTRGFDQVINIQGSDHHSTILRVRSGLQALDIGIPKGYPHYVLHKMVTVMRNGEEIKISKRAGSYVTVRDLIEWSGGISSEIAPLECLSREEIIRRGRDAVRFFLISRKADTEFIFNVDLALDQNDENPVYYVQYAHARICSILTQWGGDKKSLANVNLSPLTGDHASVLLKLLAEYPDMLTRAAKELAPHVVAFYLQNLASAFHSFYKADRVLVTDEIVKQARLALLAATKQVLQNGLVILGVSAPTKM
ncbi:arginine--tRNA ligase [Candidatus Pandoraea novymonadis]|uniref:Arginine--tRNA ligase n=1 Tax=Candidatus Pandoraea novymonadis TaxID=1808959 RepID=A0ABX5FFB7_9BURK|nr:arginine--tRNA ligase [Candidatus Pandoraea novymonadis]PSB91727.1 Arginine-tRNA ligase [Candidatus Pandoraea novymonadis]